MLGLCTRMLCDLLDMTLQGQWRLIKLSGITRDWDAVIANVLGLGTATMLAWHALNHRLPFNRSLALSLLQFCLLIGTNGLIVDAMRTEWPEKLEARVLLHMHVKCIMQHINASVRGLLLLFEHYAQVSSSQQCFWQAGADKANGFGRHIFGKAWPRISGLPILLYSFAVLVRYTNCLHCSCLRDRKHLQRGDMHWVAHGVDLMIFGYLALQLIAFFYVVWFVYRMEHGHRRAFLLQYQIDPDTCNFSNATYYDVLFLAANVMVITGTMTHELLELYECAGPLGQQLVGNCTLPAAPAPAQL